MKGSEGGTRHNEWWVPKWGPQRLRSFIGMSYYPYSLMNASYPVIGSLLSPTPNLFRAGLLALVYLLAVGISAHALDATAPNRPWGDFMSRNQLFLLALATLLPALSLGLYLAVSYAPALILVGSVELFFLLAYNLELFGGRFHTDLWFSFSWGFLPVVAGFVLQTDTLDLTGFAGGLFGFLTAFVEISASRPYKALKKQAAESTVAYASKFESVLKGVVLSVFAVAVFLYLFRALG